MSEIQLGLGCVTLGTDPHQSVAQQVRLVHGAIDLGYVVFDTADAYGSGTSEHVLGRALRGRRDEVTIATKAGFGFRSRSPLEQWVRRRVKPTAQRILAMRAQSGGSAGPTFGSNAYSTQDFSPTYLRSAVHASLRRLGTDRIDVFQLHGPGQFVPGVVDALADLVTAGDVARIGVGADSVAAAAAWKGVEGVSVIQLPFGVLDPEAAAEFGVRQAATDQNHWARGVFGGGLLSMSARDPDALAGRPEERRVRAIASLADRAGLDLHDFALRFVRSHSDWISTVLVGSSSLDHLRRNAEALAEPPLDPALLSEAMQIAALPQERGDV
jgi:aryl-alcohol dehydrogenase-like predicted oxidoreductase